MRKKKINIRAVLVVRRGATLRAMLRREVDGTLRNGAKQKLVE